MGHPIPQKAFQDRKDAKDKDKRKTEERVKQEKEERNEKSNLLQELITLRNEKEVIEAKCHEAESKEMAMNELIISLEKEKSDFETKYFETHSLLPQIQEKEEKVQNMHVELIQLNELHSELRTEMDTMKKSMEIESKKMQEQLDKEKKENERLSNQIITLKDCWGCRCLSFFPFKRP